MKPSTGRWESLKPDAPNQLTSLLVLYQCVARIFAARVRALDAQLQLNEELRSQNLLEVSTSTVNCIANSKQARVLIDRFRPRHKQFVLFVFRNVDPFKRFLNALQAVLAAPNGHYLKEYLYKPEAKRNAVCAGAEGKGVNPNSVIDEPIHKLQRLKEDNNLLFFSIGTAGYSTGSLKSTLFTGHWARPWT